MVIPRRILFGRVLPVGRWVRRPGILPWSALPRRRCRVSGTLLVVRTSLAGTRLRPVLIWTSLPGTILHAVLAWPILVRSILHAILVWPSLAGTPVVPTCSVAGSRSVLRARRERARSFARVVSVARCYPRLSG